MMPSPAAPPGSASATTESTMTDASRSDMSRTLGGDSAPCQTRECAPRRPEALAVAFTTGPVRAWALLVEGRLEDETGGEGMRIKHVMTKFPKWCRPSDSAQHAAQIMRDEHAGKIGRAHV